MRSDAPLEDAAPAPHELENKRLEREVVALAERISSATSRFLSLVGELDHRKAWADWGTRSCAEWLSFTCGLSPRVARSQVRVAESLAGLPNIAEAFAAGELSLCQTKPGSTDQPQNVPGDTRDEA